MFQPSRDQARQFFVEAWRKQQAREVLTPLEDLAARIVALHPEYHALLADPHALGREWTPESGAANPFLHLSLHLAIEEQLSIDQPFGIRAAFEAQLAKRGDRHEALHVVLECLGETIWQAQRSGRGMDGAAYLECIRRRLG
jgi:hypothetical protein